MPASRAQGIEPKPFGRCPGWNGVFDRNRAERFGWDNRSFRHNIVP